MIPPIVLFDDPRLTTDSTLVDLNSTDDLAVIRMVGQYAQMMASPVVSAPIFALNMRLMFISHNNRQMPLMNPVLTEARDYEFVNELLWPNLPDFKLRARRPKYVSIQAMMQDGNTQNIQVSGENAQLVHWHLELMNGTAPIFRLTAFQQVLVYRMQYFRERSRRLALHEQFLKLAEKLSAESDPHLSFDGGFEFTTPSMAELAGLSDSFKIDLRDPFGCLSVSDQKLLQIFSAHHNQAGFCLFQVANPMLVMAANMISPKDRVISVANEAGKHALDMISDSSIDCKIPLVTNKLSELAYREKPDSMFMDWCWPDDETKDIEAEIRKISKKLTADGVLYLGFNSNSKVSDLAKSVLSKIFPRVASNEQNGQHVLAGFRSPNSGEGRLQIAENHVPFPSQPIP